MVRQSTTAHVWHCKILNAPSNFGDIFARALVAQTRPLLTFPTIRSIIEASLLCDSGLWDYPSQSKALLLHFDKWEILRIFSPIWNRHIHILNPELPGYTWSIGLKWRPLSNYPIELDWKLWFLTQWILDFPRWKLILSRNVTRSWWLRHLHLVWIIRLVNLWVSFSGTLNINDDNRWTCHTSYYPFYFCKHIIYKRTTRLPWKSPPLYVCHCPFDSFDSQPGFDIIQRPRFLVFLWISNFWILSVSPFVLCWLVYNCTQNFNAIDK